MTAPPPDPSVWPLAPGNAPDHYEAAFARQVDQWKVPLDAAQYDVIRGIFARGTSVAA
jgi:hypothetical protein